MLANPGSPAALAQKACREGYSAYAYYQRLTRLLQELPLARGDGSYAKLFYPWINGMTSLGRNPGRRHYDLLIFRDCGKNTRHEKLFSSCEPFLGYCLVSIVHGWFFRKD